jgi:hypothetical protein
MSCASARNAGSSRSSAPASAANLIQSTPAFFSARARAVSRLGLVGRGAERRTDASLLADRLDAVPDGLDRKRPERACAGVGKVDDVGAALQGELGLGRIDDARQHQGHGGDA